jgi:hypothetical protein
VNDGELALWAGEKIGLLSFSSKPGLRFFPSVSKLACQLSCSLELDHSASFKAIAAVLSNVSPPTLYPSIWVNEPSSLMLRASKFVHKIAGKTACNYWLKSAAGEPWSVVGCLACDKEAAEAHASVSHW